MFKLRIETKNAAFGIDQADSGTEVARILETIRKDLLYSNKLEGSLFDSNGNKVGTWKLTKR